MSSVQLAANVLNALGNQIAGDRTLDRRRHDRRRGGHGGFGSGCTDIGNRLALGLGDLAFCCLGAAGNEVFHLRFGFSGDAFGIGLGAGDDVLSFISTTMVFGTPLDEAFQVENLARNDYVLHVLREVGLYDDFLSIARKVAETMVELFADIAPGHPFFEQFSFISSDDLPEFQTIEPCPFLISLEKLPVYLEPSEYVSVPVPDFRSDLKVPL